MVTRRRLDATTIAVCWPTYTPLSRGRKVSACLGPHGREIADVQVQTTCNRRSEEKTPDPDIVG